MQKKFVRSIVQNSRGFSLLEVLMGVTVFMIGMLGVTALNISSLKSNTFSGNMSEAIYQAADKLEEVMATDYDDLDDIDDDGDGQLGDFDNDGLDDDDPADTDAPATYKDGVLNFGLDDIDGDADDSEPGIGKNNIFDVYWNVAVDEPVPNTTTVNVIVRWQVKDVWRQINMSTIRVREL